MKNKVMVALAAATQLLPTEVVSAQSSPLAKSFLMEAQQRPELKVTSVSELVKEQRLCGNDRILIAPDGKKVAVWRGKARHTYTGRSLVQVFPDRVHTVSLFSDEANTFSSSISLEPISWSPDAKELHVSVAGQFVVSVDIGSEETRGFKLPEGLFTFARTSSTRVLSATEVLDQFTALSAFASYNKAQDERLFFTFGNEPIGLKFSSTKGKIELSDGQRARGNPADLFAIKDLRFLRDKAGVSFVGYGANSTKFDSEVPYLSSVFDKSTGQRTHVFGAKALYRLRDGSGVSVFEAKADEVILDVDRVGDVYAILLEGLDRSRRIMHGSIGKLREARICPADISWPPGMPLYVSPFNAVETGKHTSLFEGDSHSVSYVLWKAKSPHKEKLTIFFHGGPLASSLSPGLRNDGSVARYSCSDVMMIDGTGTVGNGFRNSSNASRLGFDAFHRDVILARDLARSLGYSKVHVVGASFGGISGAAASKIHWPELKSISLLAPALQLLRPEQTSLSRGEFVKETVSIEGLRGFQDYVFGNKFDDINQEMTEFLAHPDSRVHVYLGDEDKQVPIELLPKNFPDDQLTVIDGGDHSSIFRHRDVKRSLRESVCGANN